MLRPYVLCVCMRVCIDYETHFLRCTFHRLRCDRRRRNEQDRGNSLPPVAHQDVKSSMRELYEWPWQCRGVGLRQTLDNIKTVPHKSTRRCTSHEASHYSNAARLLYKQFRTRPQLVAKCRRPLWGLCGLGNDIVGVGLDDIVHKTANLSDLAVFSCF